MSTFRGLPEQTASAIYDILVAHAGAEDGYGRERFVSSTVRDGDQTTQYRFGGSLGHGGKFYRHRKPITHDLIEQEKTLAEDWTVGCYPEDETPERKEAIRKANLALYYLNLDGGPLRLADSVLVLL